MLCQFLLCSKMNQPHTRDYSSFIVSSEIGSLSPPAVLFLFGWVLSHFFFNFYQNVVDLQCWVSFRCIAKLISYIYVYPLFWASFPIQVIIEYRAEFPVLYSRSLFYIWQYGYGEGSGTPLQYSCLENPVDGGAWQASVQGVTRSQTRLSNFTLTLHFHALEREMATHSSVLAWRIPGMVEPGGLPSMGSHKVRHN